MNKAKTIFRCESVKESGFGDKIVKLYPVTSSKGEFYEKNNHLFNRFPEAKIKIQVEKNAPAKDLIVAGKEYCVDFTEVNPKQEKPSKQEENNVMDVIEYIKTEKVFYVPHQKFTENVRNRREFPAYHIKELSFGRIQVDYFNDYGGYLEFEGEQGANERVVLYPSGIKEIKYSLNC